MEVVNAVTMAHHFIHPKLSTANLVIDATAGNGYDTLFLAENTSKKTTIVSFDIQAEALAKTEILLSKHSLLYKVRLILDSHANIANYINQPIDAAMFNLGYLPGGNHLVSTSPDTTLQAMTNILQCLKTKGLITIAAYPGYEHGRVECQTVHEYLTNLNQKAFTVGCWSMVNQKNNPPVLYIIQKNKEWTA